jgi:predicted transcriptional regulator
MGMTSVRMPDELLAQLEATAEKLRRSKGWIINDAVKEYLAKQEREASVGRQTACNL